MLKSFLVGKIWEGRMGCRHTMVMPTATLALAPRCLFFSVSFFTIKSAHNSSRTQFF